MKILITGANGFLGYYLVEKLLDTDSYIIATGKGDSRLPFKADNFLYIEMDFTNADSVNEIFLKYNPEIIIHAGAMSKPDECEINKDLAYNINVIGTNNLLEAAKLHNCFFSFISTDFIFDGKKGNYLEGDLPAPVNYYGQTKLFAEENVKEYKSDWNIIRTILVYGKPNTGRQNLLTVIKSKLENKEGYSVFDDQIRTPTYVGDLANGIITAIKKKAIGVFHIAGKDELTPYEMACKTADFLGLNKNLLRKITQSDLKEIAIRPPITGFDISKAKTILGYNPISFEQGLIKTFPDQK